MLHRLYNQSKRLFHRLYLWTKPSYRRHRTIYQKQFDIRLLYIFLGCLIGISLVTLFSIFRKTEQVEFYNEDIQQITDETDEEQKKETAGKTPFDNLLLQNTEDKVKSLQLTLNKNEALSSLLKRADLSMQEALDVSKALDLVFSVKKLRPGQVFELYFTDKDNIFLGLKMETRNGDIISVLKNDANEFIPQTKEGVIETKHFVLDGIIETTFSEAAEKIEMPALIVNQVIRALDGQVDFNKDLKTGETFTVVYEQKMTDKGKIVGNGLLLYVSLSSKKSTYQRYFFIDGAGNQGFYNENGESAPQNLLQRPLGKGRISSSFGMRTHPILGYKIEHKGVDFPAKKGTPIPAAADGVIKKIGRNGGHGKYIKIQHNNTYSTAYSHMDAFAKDLKSGSYVKKGETIGYVGNTGRSTGPHLHYEVIKNGKQVNPLKTHTIPQRTLKNNSLSEFKKKKEKIDLLIKKAQTQ